MNMPVEDLPDGADFLARRGVLTHITVGGERTALIVPVSLMDTMRILGALLANRPAAEELPGLLPTVYPWARSLPSHELRAFAAELGDALRSDEDDAPEEMERVVDGWRATAEAYGDADVRAAFNQPLDDYGPVPEPVAP